MTQSIRPPMTTARGAAAALGALALLAAVASPAQANPTEILFVGNSFTFGKYAPVRNYLAGFDSGPGAVATPHVHDLQCLTLAGCSAAENKPTVAPSTNPTVTGQPGGTLGQLNYLNAHSTLQFTEPGPFGGIPGIFLRLTQEAHLSYDVSIDTISSATLKGTWNNATNLPVISSAKWDRVVLQEQSFTPLPTVISVNGVNVTTRGKPANFNAGVQGIVNSLYTNDTMASRSLAGVTLYETQPLASYSYLSTNPSAPIFGSSTGVVPGGNNNQPYVGDAKPVQSMASDLHNSFLTAAANANALHKNAVNVGLAGDAWITAMNNGVAMVNPYLVTEPPGQIDLWDSNALDACCTTPIGYHPSKYGAYLSALVLFEEITGLPPGFGANEQAAFDLGIDPTIAAELQYAAILTVAANGPTVPEPASIALLGVGLFAALGARRRRG